MIAHRLLVIFVFVLGPAGLQHGLFAQQHGQPHQNKAVTMQNVSAQIPSSLKAEHAEIHAALEAATKLPGETGVSARALAKVLHPHFVREEQIALPPLGLLERLANDKYDSEMSSVLPMVDSLRAELPRMLAEHRDISAATHRMATAAAKEHQEAVVQLADKLLLHAQTEQQVMYPAAVLVGEIVRGRTVTLK